MKRSINAILPDHVLEKVDPKDRKYVKGLTEKEAYERYEKRSEAKERRIFENWLRLNGLIWCSARTDKKSTINRGWPDLSIFCDSKTLFGDFKSTGRVLSKDQEYVKLDLERSGFKYYVWYDADSAIRATKKFFGLKYVRQIT